MSVRGPQKVGRKQSHARICIKKTHSRYLPRPYNASRAALLGSSILGTVFISRSGKRSPKGTQFSGRSGRGLRCGMGDTDPWPACPTEPCFSCMKKTTPPSPGNYSAARLTFSNGLSLALRNYSAAFWKLLRASLSAYTYFQRFSLAACAE